MELNRIIQGDCLEVLKTLPDNSIQCCVTSPPYWNLRNYSVDGQLGLEPTPDEYVSKMVDVFREVHRVLRKDGTLWLNLGDSYAANRTYQVIDNKHVDVGNNKGSLVPSGLKPKDLIGIPWRVAFALQEDGWWLRQDIIWCLSGGTWVYARTQKGDMPIMVRDLYRLKPETVQLWNGQKWTNLLGMSKNKRCGEEIEFILRSGERISCTPTHKFPTNRGLLEASELQVGDILQTTLLPPPDSPRSPMHINTDAAWLAGLYIAEGSKSGDCIQIAGHAKETSRWERLKRIAESYGGAATRTVSGNKMDIRLYGKVLNALLSELVSGRTAKDKCFAPVVWRYDNIFIAEMLDGYLAGDGSFDEKNNRWRLGFTRNYNLERDLRTACARLGYRLTLNISSVPYNGSSLPTFRGEIRKQRSGHHNEAVMSEVVAIRKARCREVYDLGVEDEPHLFALASGILTHNSKPNPMPESVRDRCTKAHEYIFLLSKSERYYYDIKSISEPLETSPHMPGNKFHKDKVSGPNDRGGKSQWEDTASRVWCKSGFRNRRSVWSVTTEPFPESHFATFPTKLIEPCILAGSRIGDTVLDPFMGAGTTAVVSKNLGRNYVGIELNPEYIAMAERRIRKETAQMNMFHSLNASHT